MQQLPRIKQEMENLQQRIGPARGGGRRQHGMVKVRVNGRYEVLSVKLSDEALRDREMVEDLIAAATNQAIGKVRQLVADETGKMATDLGLPPGSMGMGLPGVT